MDRHPAGAVDQSQIRQAARYLRSPRLRERRNGGIPRLPSAVVTPVRHDRRRRTWPAWARTASGRGRAGPDGEGGRCRCIHGHSGESVRYVRSSGACYLEHPCSRSSLAVATSSQDGSDRGAHVVLAALPSTTRSPVTAPSSPEARASVSTSRDEMTQQTWSVDRRSISTSPHRAT